MDLLAIIIAAVAAFTAYRAWRAAEQIATVQLFLQLRESHSGVHRRMQRMKKDYHDATWDPTTDLDPTDRLTIESYWLQAFTEWYSTTRLNNGKFSYLWADFYEKAVVGGLRNEPLRRTLCKMDSTFSGHGGDFVVEIRRLYRLANEGKELCVGDATPQA
jgi:hypothetical protein